MRKFWKYLLYLLVINMATVPAFLIFQGGFNGLLLLIMCLSPLILLFSFNLYKHESVLLLFLAAIFFFPFLTHPESIRWSTILYSAMFCFTFMAFVRLCDKSDFTIVQYISLIKFLIYAYFAVLLIQQFCVFTGLPIFLVNQYVPDEPWKLNSLSLEPSHTARFVPLLMYSFITSKELIIKRKYDLKIDLKNDKYLWIAFLWTMVTMGSGTAFLFIPIVLLKFIRGRNIVYMALLVLLVWFAGTQITPKTVKRASDTFLATLTLDENKIMKADGSAASRIVPLLLFAKNAGFATQDDWFGHGCDSSNPLIFSALSKAGYPKVNYSYAGAMLYLWYDYGFISFILFAIFSILVCWRKGDFLSIIFWFFIVFLNGINFQLVWICIMLLYANKTFENKMQ